LIMLAFAIPFAAQFADDIPIMVAANMNREIEAWRFISQTPKRDCVGVCGDNTRCRSTAGTPPGSDPYSDSRIFFVEFPTCFFICDTSPDPAVTGV
jgi:hypothetical protein